MKLILILILDSKWCHLASIFLLIKKLKDIALARINLNLLSSSFKLHLLLSLSQLLVWYANSSLSLLGNHLFLNIFYTKTQTHIFIYVYIYIYWCGAVLVDVQNSPPPTSASGGTRKILSTTMPETCC